MPISSTQPIPIHVNKPFKEEDVAKHLDLSKVEYLEVRQTNNDLLDKLRLYLAHLQPVHSTNITNPYSEDSSLMKLIGLGLFTFDLPQELETKHGPQKFWALHQTIGEAKGHDRDGIVDHCSNLVLFASNKQILSEIITIAKAWGKETSSNKVHIETWNHCGARWSYLASRALRPTQSVVLDGSLQEKILNDVREFVKKDTKKWYRSHGIHHRRSYLFFGPPGGGKTSMIHVIASEFNRVIKFLQPCHPLMTDSTLSQAFSQLRLSSKSLVVLEDVDALFTKDRKTLDKKTPLTFSGLLNALDGIATEDDVIIIMTTNHVERLDPALIRAGRIDMKIEFPSATEEQVRKMFSKFFPLASLELVEKFWKAIQANFKMEEHELSMATLQNLFIQRRKLRADDVITSVGDYAQEIRARNLVEEMMKKEKTENENENENENDGECIGGACWI